MPSTPRPDALRREAHRRPVGPRGLRAAALALPALATLSGLTLPRSRWARQAARLGACALPVGAAGAVLAAGPSRSGSAAEPACAVECQEPSACPEPVVGSGSQAGMGRSPRLETSWSAERSGRTPGGSGTSAA
ncbi:MAG TPA: hypothetical protein VIR16_12115, partial [Candidatus Limnocylindrales bacterium]